MIYFDNAATTYVDKDALDAFNDVCLNNFGNPSGNYKVGNKAKDALENARKTIGRVMNCDPQDIVFTSGGTESNNTVIQSFNRMHPGLHIISSSIEHKSVLKLLRWWQLHVSWVRPDKNGFIDPKEVEKLIRPDTQLISIQMMNNELGTLQNIEEIAKIAKKHNIFFHTDAVQAVGHLPINIEKLGIDALSASGHKFGAPKGIGFLFTKDKKLGLNFGGTQEHKQRAGTENVAGAVSMAVALDNCDKHMNENMKKISRLVSFLEEELLKIPGVKLNINNPYYHSIINLRVEGVNNQELMSFLDERDICVSRGAACSSKLKIKSFVLQAIGLNEEQIDSSIRISLSPQNTLEECKIFVETIKLATKELRK